MMSGVPVMLLMANLGTLVDSAMLIINTINATGDEAPTSPPRILLWGLALVVGVLLIIRGQSAIQTAMIVGPLHSCL
ncbi:MAG: hypothetical protein ACU0DJ_00970 [Paracoccus sp. (in: a-proteobacteria)]